MTQNNLNTDNRNSEIEASKARILDLAQKQDLDEQVLGKELYELQVALATPGCKGKFTAFISTLPIARSSVYRQIGKHKMAVGLISNRSKRDHSKRPRAAKRLFNLTHDVQSHLELLLDAIADSVTGESRETLIKRLIEVEYNRAMGISKLVPTTVASSEMGRTTKVVTAPIDHSEPQAA